MMILFGAITFCLTLTTGDSTIQANKICVSNQAAVVLSFSMLDVNINKASKSTPNYPVGVTKCLSIGDEIGAVSDGDLIIATLDISAGGTQQCTPAVMYDSTRDATATYTAAGTVFKMWCSPPSAYQATAPHTLTTGSSTIQANQICIANQAAVVLSFSMLDLNNNKGSKSTPNYPVGVTKCLSIGGEIDGVSDGDLIIATLDISAGGTQQCTPAVMYDSTRDATATYTAAGTVFKMWCSPPSAYQATAPRTQPLLQVNAICITNDAAFVLHWWMTDMMTNTKSNKTEDYPVAQHRCMSIGGEIQDASDGDLVLATVHADLGDTENVARGVVYDSTSTKVAFFACKGTTLNFNCDLEVDTAQNCTN